MRRSIGNSSVNEINRPTETYDRVFFPPIFNHLLSYYISRNPDLKFMRHLVVYEPCNETNENADNYWYQLALNEKYKNRILAFIILKGFHFRTLILDTRTNPISVYHQDSLGNGLLESEKLPTELTTRFLSTDLKLRQQTDGINCGPFAIHNLFGLLKLLLEMEPSMLTRLKPEKIKQKLLIKSPLSEQEISQMRWEDSVLYRDSPSNNFEPKFYPTDINTSKTACEYWELRCGWNELQRDQLVSELDNQLKDKADWGNLKESLMKIRFQFDHSETALNPDDPLLEFIANLFIKDYYFNNVHVIILKRLQHNIPDLKKKISQKISDLIDKDKKPIQSDLDKNDGHKKESERKKSELEKTRNEFQELSQKINSNFGSHQDFFKFINELMEKIDENNSNILYEYFFSTDPEKAKGAETSAISTFKDDSNTDAKEEEKLKLALLMLKQNKVTTPLYCFAQFVNKRKIITNFIDSRLKNIQIKYLEEGHVLSEIANLTNNIEKLNKECIRLRNQLQELNNKKTELLSTLEENYNFVDLNEASSPPPAGPSPRTSPRILLMHNPPLGITPVVRENSSVDDSKTETKSNLFFRTAMITSTGTLVLGATLMALAFTLQPATLILLALKIASLCFLSIGTIAAIACCSTILAQKSPRIG